MTVTALRKKIQAAEYRAETLNEWIEKLEARRLTALKAAAGDPNDMATRRSAASLAQIEGGYTAGLEVMGGEVGDRLARGEPGLAQARVELSQARDLAEALRVDLPSPAALAEARETAGQWQMRADAAERAFGEAWGLFLDALTVAETAALRVAELREQHFTAAAELQSHADQWGLESVQAQRLEPDQAEQQLAGLIGGLVEAVGYEQAFDPMRGSEIADTRRKLERAAA